MAFKWIFMNPSEKAQYHAAKLHSGINPRTGKPLTDFERGQSSGYLKARQDSADAFNAKHNPEKLKENKKRRRERREAYRQAKALAAALAAQNAAPKAKAEKKKR